jgi:metallo-beta-lactamase family protein
MCEAGRIRHHLVHNLPRRDSTVLFVGYQAAGTLGRKILEGARRVRISGRDVDVRAEVRRIDSYSAHADRSELLRWIGDRGTTQGTTFLVHGENGALQPMAEELGRDNEDRSIRIPEIGEVYELPPGKPAKRLRTGRDDLRQILSADWQNDYAEFVVQLKSRLRAVEDEAACREVIARMKRMLEGYEEQRRRSPR